MPQATDAIEATRVPVQFVCSQCRQVLSITRRKIGQQVACPRCGVMNSVPEKDAGATEVAIERATRSAGSQMEVHISDEPPSLLAPPTDAASPGSTTSPTAATGGTAGPVPMAHSSRTGQTRAADDPALQARVAQGQMLLVSRTAVYAQALLFVLVAGGSFFAGLYYGKQLGGGSSVSGGNGAGSAASASERLTLRGEVNYVPQAGGLAPDVGAIVIALPQGVSSPNPLAVRGLRPSDSLSELPADVAGAIYTLGGDVTRADHRGLYQLVLPSAQHDYHVLVISAHARRTAGESTSPAVRTLASWFSSPSELLGMMEYSLSRETLGRQSTPLSHTFGR